MLLLTINVNVYIEVAILPRCISFVRLATASAERIGSDIDVGTVAGSRNEAKRDTGAKAPAQVSNDSLHRCRMTDSPSGGAPQWFLLGRKHRVRNSCAVCVFIAGVSQGWKPGVYRAPELMEGKAAYAAASRLSWESTSCSSGLAFSARSSLRMELTRISQMVFFWAGFLPTFLVSYSRLRSSPSTCR